MKDTSITFRTDYDTKRRLEVIAKQDDRTLSYIINKIIKRYLEEQPQEES